MGLLDERARRWRAQLRRQALWEGCSRLAGPGVCLLFAVLWADRAFLFPQQARLSLLGAGLTGAVLAVHRFLWRPLRAADATAALEGAGRRFPALKDHLRPAWELKGARAAGHTSEELARAHIAQTERLLEATPDEKVFVWKPSRLAGRGLALAALSLLTTPWLGGASWDRVLSPWRDVPLERFVTVIPGDARVEWGQSAQIAARWDRASGGPREAAQLRLWIEAGSAWRQTAWDRGGSDSAGFTVAALSEPLRYRLAWRDLQSRTYTLTPVPPPQLESLSARAGGRPSVPLSAAEPLAVRRGDWVLVTGRPNQPLAKALLRVSFLPVPVVLKASSEGEVQGGFTASEDGFFRFELETSDGRSDPSPASFALKAQANAAPVIELLSPAAPLQVAPDETVPVTYSARDDAGLRAISLLLRVAGRQSEVPLRRFEKNTTEFLGDYPWDLSGLPPGTRVEFQLKAVDDSREPMTALSQTGSLEIVDFEAGHAALERRWDETEKSLAALAESEERLASALERKDAAASQKELPGLPAAWKKAARDLKDLSEGSSEDPYANPGLAEELQGLSSELSRAESQDLPPALEKARQGDPRASAAHKRLAEQARKSERLLKEGRSIQGLQDYHNEAGRMSQRGSQLEAALEGMKGLKKGQAPEAVAKLQKELKKLQQQMERLQQAIALLPQASAGSQEEKDRKGYSLPLLQAQTAADALAQAMKNGDFELAAKLAAELNAHLSSIEKGISQAAAQAAGSAPGAQASRKMEAAEALWNEVVEEQRRLLEGSQRVEERRLEGVMERQKELLLGLAKEQAVLVSSAAASGASFPADVLGQMRAVQAELESRKLKQAPALLGAAAARLRAERRDFFAEGEEGILDKLLKAPQKAPADPSDPETRGLSGKQEALRSKTGGLQRQLEGLERQSGALPRGVVDKVEQAGAAQSAAAEALGRGDAAQAQQRQQEALDLLERGGSEMGQSRQSQQSMESGMSRPFSRSSAGSRSSRPAGSSGSNTGFVPLPSAQDYLPPKELREELERSQRESRPEAYDPAVREYLKRIAR